MPPFVDLTGQRFGKLVVLRRASTYNGWPRWHCECDCGGRCKVRMVALMSGSQKTCGRHRIVGWQNYHEWRSSAKQARKAFYSR